MQNKKLHHLTRCALGFFSLLWSAAASPVEIVGTLRNSNGTALSGQIAVFQELPSLTVTHYQTDATGSFSISSNSQGGLVIHATAKDHASAERMISSGTSGTVTLNIVLPLAQDIEGRVVDSSGNAVPDAAVRVRYHEPGKPVRRVGFDRDERTDGDGRFLIRDVGIQVPFAVDVLASDYTPASSKRTKLAAGDTKLDDIVLGERGAVVVVNVLDKADTAVSDVRVMLLADPAGVGADARGSWLHHRAFRQKGFTSNMGNVRFTGVPPGRIIARIKTADGATEQRAVVSSGQELDITLRMLW
ncbi:MAG: carboxypeptidase-like regulatory domain-containing protein [Acidobacteriota bacterium]|nr:carboxypeptidase-like regulatory domain-containing protein [Acidobacteriota bacterium]